MEVTEVLIRVCNKSRLLHQIYIYGYSKEKTTLDGHKLDLKLLCEEYIVNYYKEFPREED